MNSKFTFLGPEEQQHQYLRFHLHTCYSKCPSVSFLLSFLPLSSFNLSFSLGFTFTFCPSFSYFILLRQPLSLSLFFSYSLSYYLSLTLNLCLKVSTSPSISTVFQPPTHHFYFVHHSASTRSEIKVSLFRIFVNSEIFFFFHNPHSPSISSSSYTS